jgi:hypothetical protein
VRFDTAGGPVVTRIAVSEPHAVGDTLSVVYNHDDPGWAASAATEPSLAQTLVVPGALLLPAVVLGPGMLGRRRRRRALTPLKRRRVQAISKPA